MIARRNRVRLAGLALAAVFALLSLGYGVLQGRTPTDGARLEPGERAWTRDGLIVTPLSGTHSSLRDKDEVIAVAGRSVDAWLHEVTDLSAPRPSWRLGETIEYTLIRGGQRMSVPVTLVPYAFETVFARNWSTIIFVVLMQIVATFVFLLKPDERTARVLFLMGWSLSHTYAWEFGLQIGDVVNAYGFWLYQAGTTGMWLIFWSSVLFFALVFPQVHPIVRAHPALRWQIFVVPFVVFSAGLALLWTLLDNKLEALDAWGKLNALVALFFMSATIVAIIYGYRRQYDPVAQLKARWLIAAITLCGGASLLLFFLPEIVLGAPLIDASGLGLLLLPIPIALAIAILRHQLFDIDIIIRRTLVYSALTLLLALIYYAVVFVLGEVRKQVFLNVVGQSLPELATVVGTLLTAALFVPLRRRVQIAIDRRFYRRKYDAAQILAAFGESVRDEVNLNQLSAELLGTAQDTMQPAHLSLWLREREQWLSVAPPTQEAA